MIEKPDNSKTGWILAGILLFSALLNLYGIGWGLPLSWYPDEPSVIEDVVIPMAVNLDPNPHIFWKTTAYYYYLEIFLIPYFLIIKLFGVSTGSWFSFVGTVTLISRIVTALTGTMGIYIMYLIGRNWTGSRRGGLAAALSLGVSLGYAAYSHFAIMEVPLLVIVLAGLLFCFRYLDTGRRSTLYWFSLLSGLAVSTKYNAALFAGLFFIAGHWVRAARHERRGPGIGSFLRTLFMKPLWLSLFLVFLGFFLGTPYAILDYKTFLSYLLKQMFITEGFKGYSESALWFKNAVLLKNGLGWPLLVLMVCALVSSVIHFIRKPEWKRGLVTGIPILYFAYIGSWNITAFRYVMPVIPFMAVVAGEWIFRSGIRMKAWEESGVLPPFFRRGFAALVILVLGYTAVFSLANVRYFARDTREQATQWIGGNLPDSSRVEVYAYKFYLPRFPDRIRVRTISPDFIPLSDKYQAFKRSESGKKIIRALGNLEIDEPAADSLSNRDAFTLDGLMERNPDYIVLSDVFYRRFVTPSNRGQVPFPVLFTYFNTLLSESAPYEVIRVFEQKGMQTFYLNPRIVVLGRKSLNENGKTG